MRITKPKLPERLEETQDILLALRQARQDDADITDLLVRGAKVQEGDFSRVDFSRVRFESCQFIGCDFTKSGFYDTLFLNCDLSASRFGEGYFCRCAFQESKWMGAAKMNVKYKHVTAQACNMQYINFTESTFEAVHFQETNLHNADFSQCKLKGFSAAETRFTDVSFFHTPLKGVDFTQNIVGGFLLSDSKYELSGAIVDTYQAAEFAKLLGLDVRG